MYPRTMDVEIMNDKVVDIQTSLLSILLNFSKGVTSPLSRYEHVNWKNYEHYPDSKVHGANMGPAGADRTQVGPMLVPWNLLSGYEYHKQNKLNTAECYIQWCNDTYILFNAIG